MKTKMSWKRCVLHKKLKYMLFCVCVVSIIFVAYQLFCLKELDQPITDKLIVSSMQTPYSFVDGKVHSKWSKQTHLNYLRYKDDRKALLHGTQHQDISHYLPNIHGKFICFTSKEEIDFSKVNDDYCDCPLDGSDEPGTNACNNGVFYCDIFSSKHSVLKIQSYKVNDGYCDCCDGSDEWFKHGTLSTSNEFIQVIYHDFNCKNKC